MKDRRTDGCRRHIPGFERVLREEIQVCSFGCQLNLGWVYLGVALL